MFTEIALDGVLDFKVCLCRVTSTRQPTRAAQQNPTQRQSSVSLTCLLFCPRAPRLPPQAIKSSTD